MNCNAPLLATKTIAENLLPCLLWVCRRKQHWLVSNSYFCAFHCFDYLALCMLLVCTIANEKGEILHFKCSKDFDFLGLGRSCRGLRKNSLLCRATFLSPKPSSIFSNNFQAECVPFSRANAQLYWQLMGKDEVGNRLAGNILPVSFVCVKVLFNGSTKLLFNIKVWMSSIAFERPYQCHITDIPC